MIILQKVSLSFGNQTVFNNISCAIGQNERIGLVGRNGSGKSTLLKYIAGQASVDAGTIAYAKGKAVAYLPQEVVLQSARSVLEETMRTFEHMQYLQEEAKRFEAKLGNNSADSSLIDRYVHIQEQLSDYNPDRACAEAKKVLMGLGFSLDQFHHPVSSLSVGWKMRIVLAKLLLKKADFYLFDEPTNHLDIVAKDWFLHFLSHAPFGFMLVCHERYLLDKLTTHTFEIEMGVGTLYTGNFSAYEQEKEQRMELLKKAHKQQQDDIDRKVKTIERFKAKASKAGMAQSMRKQLEKIEQIVLPPELKKIEFSFSPVVRASRVVLSVNKVGHTFNNRAIFNQVSFEIEREHKVALVAANGVGKTTLFNLIAQKLKIEQGSITVGNQVTVALFDQDQTKALDLARTIIENLEDRCPPVSRAKIRHFLGAFLFSGDTVYKKIEVLSGGEKNRVGMINVLLQNANFLLLDEPTNHLDIPSKETLLQALQAYPGTLFFVSHDHDFINKLATHVIELHAQGAVLYQGNYHDYLAHKELLLSKQESSTTAVDRVKKPSVSVDTYTESTKKIKQLERTIDKLEKEMESIGQRFADLIYGTPAFVQAESDLKQCKKKLEESLAAWEMLMKNHK